MSVSEIKIKSGAKLHQWSGDGIQACKDGSVISRHQSKASGTHSVGDGRVVYKRQKYAHVVLDELIFSNQALL